MFKIALVSLSHVPVNHAGFVRLAAQQGASLVPVLAFGELDTLRNLVDLPAVQVHFELPLTHSIVWMTILVWLRHAVFMPYGHLTSSLPTCDNHKLGNFNSSAAHACFSVYVQTKSGGFKRLVAEVMCMHTAGMDLQEAGIPGAILGRGQMVDDAISQQDSAQIYCRRSHRSTRCRPWRRGQLLHPPAAVLLDCSFA